MVKYLKVKNWVKFQHYKDRNPPWIKLSRDLLRDYEFTCLQDASKLHLMLIWLLASQLNNEIPADKEFIKNQIGVKGNLCLKELIDKGFLIDDSGTLAPCKQSAMLETEAEAEAETETERYIGDFENFWIAYGKIGNKKQAHKAYKKSIKENIDHESITRGVQKYQEHCRSINQERKFIKHASTWLNNRCWEDEYPKGKPSPSPTNTHDNISAGIALALSEIDSK